MNESIKIVSRKQKYKKKKKNKRYSIILSLVISVIILQISIFNGMSPKKDMSLIENRLLQQMPEFSLANLFNGSFTDKFEDYVSDQFLGREVWIQLKARLEISLGKNKINGVYRGKDNYFIEDFTRSSDDILNEKIEAINKFSNEHENLNVSFMLVPTATKILEDKLPKYAPVDDEEKYINDVKSQLNSKIKFINVVDSLKEHSDKDIYYKTDHHWTTKGAYIAYSSMCKQMNIKEVPEEYFNIKTVANNFYGSLYYKMGIGIGDYDSIQIYESKEKKDVVVDYVKEEKKTTSLYNNEKLDGKDKYEVFTDGNHSLIKIKTESDYKKKLLIIKDSYANSMIPFLSNHYGEIDVVDLRYYTDNLQELIETDGITHVILLFNVNTFNEDNSILNIYN